KRLRPRRIHRVEDTIDPALRTDTMNHSSLTNSSSEGIQLRADVYRFGLKDPSDVSGLREAIEKGVIDPERIVGVIGKTHGNGLVNDYTRGYLTLCLSQLIGDRLGVPAESVSKRIPFIFSGGVEGVLSPHYTVFTVDPIGAATGQEKSLAIGVAFTPELSVSD